MATGASREGAEGRRRLADLIAPYADIILKLTPALLTAVGAWLAASYQSQSAGTSLLNQREQAETQLRATMFDNLIGPIVAPQRDRALTPEDERLLVELLALNFHEHIEFKPLLGHADARLAARQRALAKGAPARDEIEDLRHSLRSVIHRVRDRQIAVLQKECSSKSRLCPEASFAERSRCAPPAAQSSPDAVPMSANPQCLTFSAGKSGEPANPHVVVSPDGRYELSLSLGSANWDDQLFSMYVILGPRDPGRAQAPLATRGTAFDFTLTPFDLPFTDNTIVDKDHRFSLVVKDVVPDYEGASTVEIWVIWFPEGYVLPHERPVNYQEIRKVLKLE